MGTCPSTANKKHKTLRSIFFVPRQFNKQRSQTKGPVLRSKYPTKRTGVARIRTAMKETSNENKMLLLKFISTVEVEAILLTLSVPFSCVMNDEPFILQYQLVTSCDANRNSHASAPPFYIKPSGTNAHGSRGANSPSAEAHLNRTGHVHPRAGSGEACPPSRLGVRWRRTTRLFRVFFSPR
jgi:hypothetical protein